MNVFLSRVVIPFTPYRMDGVFGNENYFSAEMYLTKSGKPYKWQPGAKNPACLVEGYFLSNDVGEDKLVDCPLLLVLDYFDHTRPTTNELSICGETATYRGNVYHVVDSSDIHKGLFVNHSTEKGPHYTPGIQDPKVVAQFAMAGGYRFRDIDVVKMLSSPHLLSDEDYLGMIVERYDDSCNAKNGWRFGARDPSTLYIFVEKLYGEYYLCMHYALEYPMHHTIRVYNQILNEDGMGIF